MNFSHISLCYRPALASRLARSLFSGMVMLVCSAVLSAEEASFSQANDLLFNSNHFTNTGKSSILVYEFVKSGSVEEDFVDYIELTLAKSVTPNSRRVEVNYFTGQRHRYVPPIADSLGNPVLMLFLQRDVKEMARLAQGPWRHFQNRIKRALAKDAKIESVTLAYQGRRIQGTQITIYPYREDPQRDRFARFAGKYYVFTLTQDVPGSLYQIRSVIPTHADEGVTGSALMEEALTYQPSMPRKPSIQKIINKGSLSLSQ